MDDMQLRSEPLEQTSSMRSQSEELRGQLAVLRRERDRMESQRPPQLFRLDVLRQVSEIREFRSPEQLVALAEWVLSDSQKADPATPLTDEGERVGDVITEEPLWLYTVVRVGDYRLIRSDGEPGSLAWADVFAWANVFASSDKTASTCWLTWSDICGLGPVTLELHGFNPMGETEA